LVPGRYDPRDLMRMGTSLSVGKNVIFTRLAPRAHIRLGRLWTLRHTGANPLDLLGFVSAGEID